MVAVKSILVNYIGFAIAIRGQYKLGFLTHISQQIAGLSILKKEIAVFIHPSFCGFLGGGINVQGISCHITVIDGTGRDGERGKIIYFHQLVAPIKSQRFNAFNAISKCYTHQIGSVKTRSFGNFRAAVDSEVSKCVFGEFSNCTSRNGCRGNVFATRKNIFAHHFNTWGNGNACQTLKIAKCTVANTPAAIDNERCNMVFTRQSGNCHGGNVYGQKPHASIQCAGTNCGNGFGNCDICQLCASVKCIRTDRSDVLRNMDAGKRVALIKSTHTNLAQRVG